MAGSQTTSADVDDVTDVCVRVDLGGGGHMKREESVLRRGEDVKQEMFLDALFREDPVKKRSIEMQTDGEVQTEVGLF